MPIRPATEHGPVRTTVQRIEFVEVRSGGGVALAMAPPDVADMADLADVADLPDAPDLADRADSAVPDAAAASEEIGAPSRVAGFGDPGWSLWSDAEL